MGLAFGVMFAGLSISSPHLEPYAGEHLHQSTAHARAGENALLSVPQG